MVPPSFFFLLAVSFSVINLGHVQSRKLWDVIPSPTVCLNCTICQSPCHQNAPPPPPPPPPQIPEPIYGGPPPPAPVSENPYAPPSSGVNCPPVSSGHPPPYPLGYQPPYPYGYQPPPFGYQPVVENYSSYFLPSYLVSVMLLLVSIVLLF